MLLKVIFDITFDIQNFDCHNFDSESQTMTIKNLTVISYTIFSNIQYYILVSGAFMIIYYLMEHSESYINFRSMDHYDHI